MTKFDKLYSKIAIKANYIEPNYPRMDNWAIDRYEAGEWFAAMADAGYSKWVGRRDTDGKVLWRVCKYYPAPLKYEGISVDEFEALDV